MMKRILLILCLIASLSSCARLLDEEGEGQAVNASLAMSLKNTGAKEPQTKMTQTITQSDGSSFRGIESVYIIPFKLETDGTLTRLGINSTVLQYAGFNTLIENNNSHLYKVALLPRFMNHALVYGKAVDSGSGAATVEKKHNNGVLNPVGLADPASADDISFQLEPILNGAAGSRFETMCNALVSALNHVVDVIRSFGETSLMQIIDDISRENQILSCSYATFYEIKTQIANRLIPLGVYEPAAASATSEALQILQGALEEAGLMFPVSYGMPEGAVGFWWNGEHFVRLISGVNIALVDPESYCYPPSLWYCASSSIRTSDDTELANQYVSTNPTWESIRSQYNGNAVLTSTRSVAIYDQLHYGVGMMVLNLLADSGSPALGFPLTGVIIGEQKDVDFEFNPSSASNVGIRFVYDNVIGDSRALSSSTPVVVETLVLPTGTQEKVHFALEFQNSTGNTLHGQQGDILPWCRFYLVGVLDITTIDAADRPDGVSSIFVQNRKTVVNAKVAGLENAYNTVPDLRDPQLEIGIVTEMKWKPVTPDNVQLKL